MNFSLPFFNAAAEQWWTAIVRASWQGGLALLAAWLLCRYAPGLSPVARCWIWRFAYARLFVALLWGSPILLPLLPVAPKAETAPPAPFVAVASESVAAGTPAKGRDDERSLFGAVPAPSEPENSPAGIRSPESGNAPPASPSPRPELAALLLWLGGVGVCCLRLGGACRAAERLRRSCKPVDLPELLAWRDRLADRLQLRTRPALLAGDELGSPMLLGGRTPAIVIPSALLHRPEGELRLIFAHELAHLRRGDLGWSWLAAVAHILFFFHPVVWMAGSEWRLTQEMACDELAVRASHAGVGDYAEMLLKIASLAGREPRLELTTAAAGPHHLRAVWAEDSPEYLKRRLTMLRRYVPGGRAFRPLFLTAVLLAAGALFLVPWRVTAQDAVNPAFPPIGLAGVETEISPAPTAAPGDASLPAVEYFPAPSPTPDPTFPAPGPESGDAVAGEGGPLERAGDEAPDRSTVGATGASSRGAGGSSPDLAAQWEDVLLLEAIRYLRLSDRQLRGLLNLARAAEERLETQARHEKQILATLTRIARENRAALLAGRTGGGQKDALFLENLRKQRRAEAEEKIVTSTLPQVFEVLSRPQVVRACLLTLGEPPQEPYQPLSPALLSPDAGFVLAKDPQHDPRKSLGSQVRGRVAALRSQWRARQLGIAREQFSRRYPPEVVKRLFAASDPSVRLMGLDLIISSDPETEYLTLRLDDALKMNRLEGGDGDRLLIEARKEFEAFNARTQKPLAELLMTETKTEDLEVALRPFVRRLFLSSRLRPVLEARLGMQR